MSLLQNRGGIGPTEYKLCKHVVCWKSSDFTKKIHETVVLSPVTSLSLTRKTQGSYHLSKGGNSYIFTLNPLI